MKKAIVIKKYKKEKIKKFAFKAAADKGRDVNYYYEACPDGTILEWSRGNGKGYLSVWSKEYYRNLQDFFRGIYSFPEEV